MVALLDPVNSSTPLAVVCPRRTALVPVPRLFAALNLSLPPLTFTTPSPVLFAESVTEPAFTFSDPPPAVALSAPTTPFTFQLPALKIRDAL